jgi:hypothetical protein
MKKKKIIIGLIVLIILFLVVNIIKNRNQNYSSEPTNVTIEKINPIPGDADIVFVSLRHRFPNSPFFISNEDTDYEIYTMKKDGTDITRITFNDLDEDHVAVSPDKTKILAMVLGDEKDFFETRTMLLSRLTKQRFLQWCLEMRKISLRKRELFGFMI